MNLVKRLILCERDVGLFSLIQQVVSNISWAQITGRVPIAYFNEKCCYWTPKGYRDKNNVWEYYFEPLVVDHPVSTIPKHVRVALEKNFPKPGRTGYAVDDDNWVTCNFGHHRDLRGMTLRIPYQWNDPGIHLRKKTARIIQTFIRPRPYILSAVEHFWKSTMADRHVVGVHVRGTDAISPAEQRPHRQGSLSLQKYRKEIQREIDRHKQAKVFVATDDQASLDSLYQAFPNHVIAYDSLRHQEGEAAGTGPIGWLMPAYIAENREKAARNGEEAVIEYLLLSKCKHFIHNGSSLARTVLMTVSDLPHTNTHRRKPWFVRFLGSLAGA